MKLSSVELGPARLVPRAEYIRLLAVHDVTVEHRRRIFDLHNSDEICSVCETIARRESTVLRVTFDTELEE